MTIERATGRLAAGVVLASALMAGTAFAAMEVPEFDVPTYEGVDELPEITLRLTDINSPVADGAMPIDALVEYVDRASNGKIQIEVFWSSALMTFGEAGRGIASGLADFGNVLPLYTPGDFPVNNYFNQLSMLTDGGFPGAWLTVSAAAAEFMIRNEDMVEELREFGIEPIGAWGTGGYDNLCTQPWQTLEEAAGLRTRAAGQSFSFQAAAYGAVPVPMVATEVYEAFSRGILDCVILQPNSYISQGLHEVPGDQYFVNVPLTSFNGSVMMFNKDKWDSLPPLAQQIISDALALSDSFRPLPTAKGFQDFGDLIRSGDITALSVDPEVVDTIEAFNESELERLPNEAPAAVEDGAAFIAEYSALVDKWDAIVTELGYPSDRLGVPLEEYIDSWYVEYDYTPFAERLREELNAARADVAAGQ